MKLKEVLDKLDFSVDKEVESQLQKEAKEVVSLLEEEINSQKIDAEVFLGGSFAKGTLVKKKEYDVDIYVRFDWRYEDFSVRLEKIVKKLKKYKIQRIHGSRDYFRLKKGGNVVFEIIPVLSIKKPKEGRNVTDLSYFHVNYVRRKIKANKKLAREIALAKTFCRAQGVYGAESYIQGFSGYAIECLIIHFKSFEKTLKELSKIKNGERMIIDPEKHYKKKDEALFQINESKLHSPIILIDPTWKERNATAALNRESFIKFQEAALAFLKSPGNKWFEEKKADLADLQKEAKSKKAEFLHLHLETKKQAGDIAGTKLKKFANFLYKELERYFQVFRMEFHYDENQKAEAYFIAKSKEEIIKIGPPSGMKKNASEFKKRNKNVFMKGGILHARIKVDFSASAFMKRWKDENARKVREMDITVMKVKD